MAAATAVSRVSHLIEIAVMRVSENAQYFLEN
jgi:hypothetical protein